MITTKCFTVGHITVSEEIRHIHVSSKIVQEFRQHLLKKLHLGTLVIIAIADATEPET